MDGALDQLRSLAGIAAIVGAGALMSEARSAIRWRIVLSGLALQLAFGVLVLKTAPGRALFEALGRGVNALIDFTAKGSGFVFGSLATAEGGAGFVFAFKVLPSVIFVGALMSVLYHVGIMQRVVQGMSWVMARVMGVSGAESLASAVNVFVGQTEAPLVIRPYLGGMTTSELMAVMTGGFATVAGGVLVAYVGMGVSAEHLMAASVMSAPATLVMAKLIVPERGAPATLGQGYVPIEKVSVNVLDAAASGATDGVKLAINVAGMLIAFLALVALADALLGLCGDGVDAALARAGLEARLGALTLDRVLGWLFAPLALAIGVPYRDCATYGALLGTQLSLNEFVAYAKLTELLPRSLEPDGFSTRSVMLATYSLCGFANVGSIGIQLGGIGALVESRRHDLARLGARAMLGGFLACNLTASVAGLLISNAEADFRHARALAQRHVSRGEVEPAARVLRRAAERNPGSDWGAAAAERAARVEAWGREVESGARAIEDLKKERL
jgi:CNT family concentrative nucleoside transporter